MQDRRAGADQTPGIAFFDGADEARVRTLLRHLTKRGVELRPFALGFDGPTLDAAASLAGAAPLSVVIWPEAKDQADLLVPLVERAAGKGKALFVSLDPARPSPSSDYLPAIVFERDRFASSKLDELAAACLAQVGPTIGRLRRHYLLRLGAGLGSLLSVTVAITGFDLLNAQDQFCGIPNLQPRISDFCGYLGMGDRPTKDERVNWERRTPRSCAAIEEHVRRFPDGKLLQQATALLSTRRQVATGRWIREQHVLPLFEGADGTMDAGEGESRQRALARGEQQARRLCGLYADELGGTLHGSRPEPDRWNCGGGACGFEGRAICDIATAEMHEECSTS
jgi:hypothetical protein